MNDACFESSLGKSPLGSQVVVSGSFHDDDHVLNVVLLLSFANLLHGQLEEGRLMLQGLRFDEHISKVVGHHPLGAMLRRIDAHDGELLAADLLDTRANDTVGLLQRPIVSGFWTYGSATRL